MIEEFLANIGLFVIGGLSFIALFITYLHFKASAILNETSENYRTEKKTGKVDANLILREVQKIIEQQNAIVMLIEQPNKNGLHSKYKRSLVAEWESLEKIKLDKLHSVVSSGADPLVSVSHPINGTQQKMFLSEYLNLLAAKDSPIKAVKESKENPTDSNNEQIARKITKNGRVFWLYKGGKNTPQ